MGTLITLAALLMVVGLIVRGMIKNRKAGKSVICGGDCKHCGGRCSK